jgi:hypothetical protein
MSPGMLIQAAVAEALRARAEFAELAVFDAAPVRAAHPYTVVDEAELADWSTKDWTGRSGRIAVVLHDRGERPARVRAMLGVVAEVIEALAGDLGAGWRATGFRLTRERIARGSAGKGETATWLAMSEFAVRVYRVEG